MEHTRALVSYDDRKNSAPQNPNYNIALRCENFFMQRGVKVEVKGYSNSVLEAETDWLIVIHSDAIGQSPRIVETVNVALDRVVERHMRDVMIITTRPSDLRPEWASIRKYDVSDPREESAALSDMLSTMKYVKLPYNQARNQQRRHALRNGRQNAPSVLQLILLVSALVLLLLGVVASIIYLPGYLHPASPSVTATAIARATMTRSTGTIVATQPVSGVSVATQSAKQKELNALIKGAPTIQGFRTADKWSNAPATATSLCTLNTNNTYTANINTSGQYNPCLAANPLFMNFVMQVTMNIQGDAGGVIFRSDSRSKEYYRLSVNQTDNTLSLIRCDADCTNNSVDFGTKLIDKWPIGVQMSHAKSITLTLIARANTFDVFINEQFVTSITDTSFTTAWPGQIGVYAASLGKDTTVVFSNLKVWALKDDSLAPSTSKPTSTPTAPSVIHPTVVGAQGG